jgi:DNA-binding response OmpR family regulator
MAICKLLLVDDEVEFVSTLAERLSMRGIEARTANNGDEALRLVKEDPPQVVILDLMMPGMSGLEALQRIKSISTAIQIILLTGIGSTSNGTKGIKMGAFDYLVKPIQIEELMQRILEALKIAPEGPPE